LTLFISSKIPLVWEAGQTFSLTVWSRNWPGVSKRKNLTKESDGDWHEQHMVKHANTGSPDGPGGRQQAWRFLDTGYADPFFNMALDEAIARAVGDQESPPTVRVYGWRPAAVSIGYFQRALDTLDLRRCAGLDIPVVRRLTGGRAVFHDQEVTYSVIALRNQWGSPASVLEIYRHIGLALVAALRRLGVSARLGRPQPDGSARTDGRGSHPCFSSAGRYEILVSGRKLVGSAQRWLGEVVLQHGSLLTGPGHARIAELLPHGGALQGERAVRRLREKTVSLVSLLSREVTFAEISQALFDGFVEVLGSSLVPGKITPGEEKLAHDLIKGRYGQLQWTLRI
jgi:lipoate-protein ligase A